MRILGALVTVIASGIVMAGVVIGVVLLLAFSTPAEAQSGGAPVLTCTAPGVWQIAPGIQAACPAGPTPPSCDPGDHWDGTTCAPDAPQACAATQESTGLAVSLKRSCSGTWQWMGPCKALYNGALWDLVKVLSYGSKSGPWPNVRSGCTGTLAIPNGQYVSLQFNTGSSTNGQMQFTADPSYGPAGYISLSTQPGAFAGPQVVNSIYGIPCVFNYSASNSIWLGLKGPDCAIAANSVYYINFAAVDAQGNPLGNLPLSYQEVNSGK